MGGGGGGEGGWVYSGGGGGGGGGGWGCKKPSPLPTSFSPVTSANVGISSQNFLTFIFDTFATLV